MTTTKTIDLQSLIKKGAFDYVNSYITSENFPPQPIRSSDYKLFHFDRYISSDEAEKEMKAEGYEPASIFELLSWKGWNDKYWVVALGSVAEVDGSRRVPCLRRDDSKRCLRLDWRGYGWNASCRFLAVRTMSLETEGSDSLTLSPSETLEKAIEVVKGAGYQVSKIL